MALSTAQLATAEAEASIEAGASGAGGIIWGVDDVTVGDDATTTGAKAEIVVVEAAEMGVVDESLVSPPVVVANTGGNTAENNSDPSDRNSRATLGAKGILLLVEVGTSLEF